MISVVFPAFNEGENLEPLHSRLALVASRLDEELEFVLEIEGEEEVEAASPAPAAASAASACDDSVTRGVPSMAARFSATTRAILFCSGDAHWLKSSRLTWFAPVLTTNCGRSTMAGTDTGPTETDKLVVAAAGPGAALSV